MNVEFWKKHQNISLEDATRNLEKSHKDVLELVDKLDNYKIIYHTSDLHNSEKASENIETEFEQMFLSKHNMNIKYIEIKKIK